MHAMITYRNPESKGGITSSQFHGVTLCNTLALMQGEWGKRLKEHMKTSEVTQDYLAEKMGVTQGAIAHWLKGRREINLGDFFQLCEWAGADPQQILFGKAAQAEPVPGLAELTKVLKEHPHLKGLVATPAAANDTVARALGPTPPRRGQRKRYPSIRKHQKVKAGQ